MKALAIASAFVFLLTAASVMAASENYGRDSQDKFDRLDGRGKSGVKVDVVEWEGNLEVHVYPAGELKSLAAKLDLRDKNKPVMVLGIRFKSNPGEQLVRRAILGVPFKEGFLAFQDPASGSEYDKFILTNHKLSGLAEYKLEPGPNQLYPDGHPANAVAAAEEPSKGAKDRAPAGRSRRVASQAAPYVPPQREQPPGWHEPRQGKSASKRGTRPVDEDGAIRPFDFR